MTTTADFADFVTSTDYDDLSPAVVDGVKHRILDAVGIAIGAIDDEQPFAIEVRTAAGETYAIERVSYEGYPTAPISWEAHEEKFHGLAAERYDTDRRSAIVEVVRTLEDRDVGEQTSLLD